MVSSTTFSIRVRECNQATVECILYKYSLAQACPFSSYPRLFVVERTRTLAIGLNVVSSESFLARSNVLVSVAEVQFQVVLYTVARIGSQVSGWRKQMKTKGTPR